MTSYAISPALRRVLRIEAATRGVPMGEIAVQAIALLLARLEGGEPLCSLEEYEAVPAAADRTRVRAALPPELATRLRVAAARADVPVFRVVSAALWEALHTPPTD